MMADKRAVLKDVYVRIVMASLAGRGVRLSADEVFDLADMDEAIGAAARGLAESNGFEITRTGTLRKLEGKE